MRNRSTLILGGLVILLAGALIFVLIAVSNQAPAYRGIEPRDDVDIQPLEPDPTIWGRNYPRQYDTWLRTQEQAETAYGGSVPKDKLEEDEHCGNRSNDERCNTGWNMLLRPRKASVSDCEKKQTDDECRSPLQQGRLPRSAQTHPDVENRARREKTQSRHEKRRNCFDREKNG